MELFLIYVVTRLTELKDGLHSVAWLAGIFLLLTIALRLLNELFTEADTKDRPVEDAKDSRDVFLYQGIRRTTKRGLWFFTPVFMLVFIVNLFVPTTRDAVVIAGGYGLVEAVKNERVQRLFTKSASVASQWLDAQLNGDDKKAVEEAKPAPAGAASAPASAVSGAIKP